MDVRLIASVSVIAPDPAASRALYVDALGLPLKLMGGDYFASEDIAGSKHFGVWPLSEAAEACFGTDTWPADQPVPQVSIESEREPPHAGARAAADLAERGHILLHPARTQPWGQIVARLQSPEGAVVGISYSPQ